MERKKTEISLSANSTKVPEILHHLVPIPAPPNHYLQVMTVRIH